MIVALDSCVLYPPSLRDLLLTLAALDAFDVRWSEEILNELARNVIDDNPDIDPSRFEQHTLGAMRSAFPDAMTPTDSAVVKSLDNHPKDRHVAAIAMTSHADGIVTNNVRDFRSRVLEAAGIAILTPGALIGQVLDDGPELALLAVEHLASRWAEPSKTPVEIVEHLARHPTMSLSMRRLMLMLR